MYLDKLFFCSIADLLDLPEQELKRKQLTARTLLTCLDSVLILKNNQTVLTKTLGGQL